VSFLALLLVLSDDEATAFSWALSSAVPEMLPSQAVSLDSSTLPMSSSSMSFRFLFFLFFFFDLQYSLLYCTLWASTHSPSLGSGEYFFGTRQFPLSAL